MSIRNSLLLSTSFLMLTGTVQAKDSSLLYLSETTYLSQSAENSKYHIAKMQFLPDYMEKLDGDLTPDPGTTLGNKIIRKGCDDGYQTSPCSGDTPFIIRRYIADNGDRCYQCRAFQESDCTDNGFYLQSYWDEQKPQASLNMPQRNMFTELFGHILGIRSAHAATDAAMAIPGGQRDETQGDDPQTHSGGGSGSSSGSSSSGNTSSDTQNCQVGSRKISNEVVSGDYHFEITSRCAYNENYVKGIWTASCNAEVYKYDSTNCGYILAGKKCGDKWDHCAHCSELYSIVGSCSATYPGVYDLAQAANIDDLNLASCSKTVDGCFYSCQSATASSEPLCKSPNVIRTCNGEKHCCPENVGCTDSQHNFKCWSMDLKEKETL